MRPRCIVCGHQRHKGVRDKFCISECEWVKYVLSATVFQEDDYIRKAYLEWDTKVFGADFMYRTVYLEAYLRKCEYAMKNIKITISPKDVVFEK